MVKILEDLGSRSTDSGKKRWVLVECPLCGKHYEIARYRVKKVQMCLDCSREAAWKSKQIYDDVGLGKQFKTYKQNAKTRDIDFHLTYEDFKTITSMPCHYCDSPPSLSTISGGSKYKYEVMSNGVDRIDSNKDYTLDNVVPCCKFCNYGKNDSTYDEFVSYLKRVSKKWA